MNSQDKLSPEELALARLLGRPGPTDGPGARLDADILALARAPLADVPEAISTPASAAPAYARASSRSGWNRRRRLTSSLAVAASLVLVVGLAWQLQPTTPQLSQQHATSVEAPTTATDAADNAAEPQAASAAAVDSAEPATPMTAAAPPAPQANAERPDRRETVAAEVAAAPASEGYIARQATPASRPLPSTIIVPPAPPAPAAPPQILDAQAEQRPLAFRQAAADVQGIAPPQAPAPARSATARTIPHAGEKAMAKAAATRQQMDAAASAAGIDIEADTQLSRRQWIKRIRERMESGDVDGARASLHRFTYDYPEARVPRDLQPLLSD